MSSVKKKNPVKNNVPKSQFLFLFGIIVLTVILYAGSIHNGFINGWDDDLYVNGNRDIMNLSMHGLKNLCTRFYGSCYLPLTMFSYALEYKLFGMNPTVFHVDNIIIHLLNTILVYIFISSLLSIKSSDLIKGKQSKEYGALICALLFGIHPMHVESVAWISERKDVMYTFFYLASLIYYIKFIVRSEERRAMNKYTNNLKFKIQYSKFWFFSLFLFTLSLLSKSMAVTLPLVLILIDYLAGRFIINAKFKIQNLKLPEKVPFFILALIFGIITFISQHALSTTDYDKNVLNINIVNRIFMLFYSISFYIVKLLVPINLSAIYPYPYPSQTGGFLPLSYYLSPLLIAVIIYLMFKVSNNLKSIIIFGILFYIITISVVLMILPVGHAIVAERYTYMPYLGFFIIFAGIYDNLKFKLQSSKSKILIFNLCLLFFILYFSYLTYSRTAIWQDGITLFSDVIKKHPDSSVAYNGRGFSKNNSGNYSEALADFDKAIELNPEYALSYNNRGVAKSNTQDLKGAMEDYNKAIALKTDYEYAYNNRASLKLILNDYKGVIEDFGKSLALNPEYDYAFNKRGLAKANTGDFNGALRDYNQAIVLNHNNADAYTNRGFLKENMKDYNGALQDLNIATNLNSREPKAFYGKGFVENDLHDYKNALEDLNSAISLNPNNPEAYFIRGNVNLSLKDAKSACEDWNSALKLGLKQAQNNISLYCSR